MLRNRNSQGNTKLVKKSKANIEHKKKHSDAKQPATLDYQNVQSNSRAIPSQSKQIHHHLEKHYASTTQFMYSSFGTHCYLPPHLSSIQIKQNVFRAEPKQGRIRPSSAKKYDYDEIYSTFQSKYQVFHQIKKSPRVSRQWSGVKSKIKYLVDEDRLTYNHFHSVKTSNQLRQREKHPDDDLSQQSSVENNKQ